MLEAYGFLALAIIFEVFGTTMLVKSAEFSKWPATLAMVVLYVLSFYCLSKSIRVIPIALAYAIWAGVGIVLTAFIGRWVFKNPIDAPAIIGIFLIVLGVVVINGFSSSIRH